MTHLIGIYDHNLGTNEVRQMTADEIAQKDAEIELAAQAKTQKEADALAKEIAKAALLERLGITEDEAKLLLG